MFIFHDVLTTASYSRIAFYFALIWQVVSSTLSGVAKYTYISFDTSVPLKIKSSFRTLELLLLVMVLLQIPTIFQITCDVIAYCVIQHRVLADKDHRV